MYTAFYGLREKPFALSPDPRFLYLAASHREALAHLLYGIEQGEGFISVTGEVGTGKTTLCRTLLERLEGEIEVAFLFNPSRTALELLQSICVEFGLPAEGLARRSLMAQLNGFLVDQKSRGRRVLLIIDEAQTLSESTLEQVRLLSNLETSREKLIQILLLGQPELDRKLDERGLRQLRQRISVRWKLSPLEMGETGAYVRHRLSVASGEPRTIFSDSALREIYRRTGGIPRLVNQLCDRALLGGYASRSEKIGPRLVRAAAQEIPDARRRERRFGPGNFTRPWVLFAAMVACVALGLYAGLEVGRGGLTDAMWSSLANRDHTDEVAARIAAETPPDFAHEGEAHASVDGSSDLLAAPSSNETNRPAVASRPPIARRLEGSAAATPSGLIPAKRNSAASTTPNAAQIQTPAGSKSRDAALAPGVFSGMLAEQDPRAALATTERNLLERFGRISNSLLPAASSAEALRASLESQDLVATAFEGGSLALLRRLNHPVALAMRPADESQAVSGTTPRWLAAVGFENDRVRVIGLLGDRAVTVPIDEFDAHWHETGIVVWERFERLPPLLTYDDVGGSVVWLQTALVELDFMRGLPNGHYDASTIAAVKRFQQDRGLVPDGVVGPLTQIALYGRLERYPVPRLSAPQIQDPPTTDTPAALSDRRSREVGDADGRTARVAGGDRG